MSGRLGRGWAVAAVVAILWGGVEAGAKTPTRAKAPTPVEQILGLLQAGRYDEARQKVQGLKSSDRGGIDHIGQEWRKLGKYDEGIETYRKLLEFSPRNSEAYFWIGTLQRYKGDLGPALESYSRALEIAPGLTDALVGRARVWKQKGDLQREEQDLVAALQASPDNLEANDLIAEIYFDRGETERGVAAYVKAHPGARPHEKLARAYEQRKNLAGAADEYEQWLREDPRSSDARRGLARLARERGDVDGAIRQYEAIVKADPQDADAHFWLGTLYRRQNQLEKADREFDAALKLKPEDTDSLVGRSRTLLRLGRTAEAVSLAKKAVNRSPENAEARGVLARALEASGEPAEAREQYAEGFRLSPSEESWRGLLHVDPLVSPTITVTGGYRSSEILEGRGNPPPFPVRVRYRGAWAEEVARIPLSPSFALTMEAEQFRDAIRNLTNQFTIYDFNGYTASPGVDYVFSPQWRATAALGYAFFESNNSRSLRNDAVVLTKENVYYTDTPRDLSARVGFHRSYLFGRNLVSPSVFRIFDQNHGDVEFDKFWGSRWAWRTVLGYTHWDDSTNRPNASTRVKLSEGIHTVSVSGGYDPRQTRFLKPDTSLDLVGVAYGDFVYKLQILEPLELQTEYQYSAFDDSNHEHFWRDAAIYRTPALWSPFKHWFARELSLKPAAFGLEYTQETYEFLSPRYNSLDLWSVSPFTEIEGTLVPYLDFDLRYAHSFYSDNDTAHYNGDVFNWDLQAYVRSWLRVGTSGRFSHNSLPENGYRIGGYAKVIF